jgi:predicted GH43/DUF377 family glycosyl hydrolase
MKSAFALLLICASLLPAQEIPFTTFSRCDGLDPFSYAPQMMLRHTTSGWQRAYKNPVLTRSKNGWDSKDAADPCIVVTPTDIFMFYDGDNNDRYRIGLARLTDDFWLWEKQGMVLDAGKQQWESYHVIDPSVTYRNQHWQMWYSGNSSDSPLGYQLGHVSSQDIAAFQQQNDSPVLSLQPESWDKAGLAYADVLFDPVSNQYKMWYSGFSGPISSIGYAVSSDGLNWQRQANKPVYTMLPGLIAPDVIFDGENYIMYYAQLYLDKKMKTKISRAISPDGVNWSFDADILLPEGKWEGSKLMAPSLAFIDQQVQLFYTGQKGSRWSIGKAFATPEFRDSGEWVSKEQTKNIASVSLIFEEPAGSRLQVFAGDGAGSWQEMTAGDSEPLPYKRTHAHFTLSSPEMDLRYIRLLFTRSDDGKSPVVYQLQSD